MLCMADVFSHPCGCGEDTCPECKAEDCGRSHGCHDDPCPDDVIRLDQDDLSVAHFVAELPATMPNYALGGFTNDLEILSLSWFSPTTHSNLASESSVFTVSLPLLI